MSLISAVAGGAARVWWAARYWMPRASDWRARGRSLELGIEYQLARQLPADEPWRQQIEADIDAHPAPVPVTAALLRAAIEDRPLGSRRWQRRQMRAVRRARLRGAEPATLADTVPAHRGRRVLLRFAPVAAALYVGYVIAPVLHPPTPAPASGTSGSVFRYSCSHCAPVSAKSAGWKADYVLIDGQLVHVPIFADPVPPPASAEQRK